MSGPRGGDQIIFSVSALLPVYDLTDGQYVKFASFGILFLAAMGRAVLEAWVGVFTCPIIRAMRQAMSFITHNALWVTLTHNDYQNLADLTQHLPPTRRPSLLFQNLRRLPLSLYPLPF